MRTLINFNNYGNIQLNLKKIMDAKDITISKMVTLSGMHHKVIERYYNNIANRYDSEVLAKFCYILECNITDILTYQTN